MLWGGVGAIYVRIIAFANKLGANAKTETQKG